MAEEHNDFDDVQEIWRSLRQREAAQHAHGVAGLKAAIPYLKQLCVTQIIAEYNGEGDSGDLQSFTIEGTVDAPTTEKELDEALKKFPEEMQAHTKFCSDRLRDYMFELLPCGFEINEGSYGTITIDCETDKVRREHNERIQEIRSSEQEW